MPDVLTIDLSKPPEQRWRLTSEQAAHVRELLQLYKTDMGLAHRPSALLLQFAFPFLPPDYKLEMESLAATAGVPLADVLLCNLYYDALKAIVSRAVGCTAFAVETATGILHARNLDWWSTDAILAKYTCECRFVGGPQGEFTTVGWPGFAGVLSGIAPGRFAVTLNSVLSNEPPRLATPVVFLLRRVLEEAESYQAALATLAETPIPCDCLLLLSGTQPGQIAVIERTPTRHAIIGAAQGAAFVTNHYRRIDGGLQDRQSSLAATACARLDRIQELVRGRSPDTPEECLRYLSDPGVKMGMTMQQMVFHAASGRLGIGATTQP